MLTKGCCAVAGTKDFETVASACGLTRLLDLDLDSSYLDADLSSSGAIDRAAAAAAEPLALARSAAALQRLVVRCVSSGADGIAAKIWSSYRCVCEGKLGGSTVESAVWCLREGS